MSMEDCRKLRRIERILHRWCEAKCGMGNKWVDWHIEDDGPKPIMVTYCRMSGTTHRRAIPDRETGALRRLQAVCIENGLDYHYQTDPRGCAVYVAATALNDSNYTVGVPCYVK